MAGAEVDKGFSLRRLLLQDFRRLDDEREEEAARERIRALAPIPAFLLGVHLICAAAVVAAVESSVTEPAGLAAALGAILMIDTLLWIAHLWRPVSQNPPHVTARFAAGYSLVATALWCAVIPAAGLLPGSDGALLEIGLACAVFAIPIGLLVSPGLAAVGSMAAIAASIALWRDPWVTGAATLISTCLVRLSLARAQEALARLRRRIAMDWNAQRASRFIEEFEQAGRGWFWETSARGALTYVSDQLAADLTTAARKLIGKPFSDLIGTDESGTADSSERTLGFHLSARLPVSLAACG